MRRLRGRLLQPRRDALGRSWRAVLRRLFLAAEPAVGAIDGRKRGVDFSTVQRAHRSHLSRDSTEGRGHALSIRWSVKKARRGRMRCKRGAGQARLRERKKGTFECTAPTGTARNELLESLHDSVTNGLRPEVAKDGKTERRSVLRREAGEEGVPTRLHAGRDQSPGSAGRRNGTHEGGENAEGAGGTKKARVAREVEGCRPRVCGQRLVSFGG